jgi:AsmA protein
LTQKTAAFNFDARSMSIDTVAERMNLGELDFSALGISVAAKVEPFSYAGSLQPKAELRVAEFSLKELMRVLDEEPPATANDGALNRVSFSANAAVTANSLVLDKLTLKLDDSTMTGSLSLPTTETGAIGFDLKVDVINLDDYMAPADESAPIADEGSVDDIEIPVDMIRAVNADGKFRIDKAYLTGMEFTNINLGLKSDGGKLRMNPLSADLYGGSYNGDVRIDASETVPSIAVDEKLVGVNLSKLAKVVFETDNISGTINAAFALGGTGRNLAAIRQDLDGTMSFGLKDGAWEGTDIWHEMRAARAMFRREEAPTPKLPARTEFTAMSATGIVTDGIFANNDLLVELPFLRIKGGGLVDLPKAELDYSIEAQVLNDPKLASGMSEAELKDFTKTVVPVRISGPLASPKVRPDIEAVFRQQVESAIEEEKQKLKDKLKNRLLGGEDEPKEGEEESLEDQLKNKLLKDLIGR